MNSLYPINSHPWNTFAVNAGLLDLLEATGVGISTAIADMSAVLNVAAAATGVASDDVTLGITAPISASGTGDGFGTTDMSYFYFGAMPIIISDWDTFDAPSTEKIQLIDWDIFLSRF